MTPRRPLPELALQRRLGRGVREQREHRGLTQQELAALAGYHRTFISGVELGNRNVTLQTVVRLANALGVDPVALLSE